MRVPAANEAEVPRAKVVLYLLNPEHRAGKSKARFFSSHGFTPDRWQALAAALRQHARENDVTEQEDTPLGVRLMVEGPMTLADGTVAWVRTVWFIEGGEHRPRFVTGYPLKRSKRL